MSDLIHAIQSMPLAGLVPAVMLLIAGLVLWMAGRTILRGAFILMGFLLGALIGLLMDDSWQTGLPGWVLPVLCGVVLAVIAGVAYRLAAAVMMAIVLGIACPLCVSAVNEWQVERGRGISAQGDDNIEVDDSISSAIEEHQAGLDKAKAELESLRDKASQRIVDAAAKRGLEQEATAGIEHVKSFGAAVAQSIKQRWNATPKRLRPMLLLSAVVGGLTGLIVGLVARRFGDCALTAMLGGAIWVGAANVIALRGGVPDGPWYPKTTIVWMAVWLVVAIIGLSIQWARRPKPADKPA
jgi:hypothetical protein